MKLEDLVRENKDRIAACENSEELVELAKTEGVELEDWQLEKVAGGSWDGAPECPRCGTDEYTDFECEMGYRCRKCGGQFI